MTLDCSMLLTNVFNPGSLSSKKSKKDVVGITRNDCFTIYSVPYSEHSSFPELVECLECLNPRKIVPTVDVGASDEQVKLLRTYWSDKKANLL
jgi:DNA repair metallo-beta-lactamase